jgi:hypothetical protein
MHALSIDFNISSYNISFFLLLIRLANNNNDNNKYRWVKRQRHQYNLLVEKKQSTLTGERIRLLESIGFVWSCLNSAWEKHFDELRQYSIMHGHWYVFCFCMVFIFIRDSAVSARFVCCFVIYRSSYYLISSYCNAYCIIYTNLLFHSDVPSSYKENLKLASWVITQRR